MYKNKANAAAPSRSTKGEKGEIDLPEATSPSAQAHPGDLAARILQLVEQHETYRLEDCLNMRADENYTDERVRRLLGSDLAQRNTSPDPTFVYRGTRYMNEIGDITVELARRLFRAEYANVWAPTGHVANMIVFFAFCRPGDKVLVVGPDHGGYGGIAGPNLPSDLGLKVLYFPYDVAAMNVDVDAAARLIEEERPALIIFGSTYFLFPQPVQELAPIAREYGIPIAYDGAHVLGLIAGGQFQDPLREGADVLFGSTMKTLAGPPGGLIVTNREDLHQKMLAATWYRAVTSTQWNRIPALGIVLADLLAWGDRYAAQVVKNAQALARSLDRRGVGVLFRDRGYTASHMILLDVGGFPANVAGRASSLAAKLEAANIIIDDRGRVGVAELTRLGMKEAEMEEIASWMAQVLQGQAAPEEVKPKVRALRGRFRGTSW